MSETKQTTKDRILDAAERLFAEKGFAETSLRDITTEAGANLASVNYHFQSKDALLRAVFDRLVGPVNRERLARLDAMEAEANGAPLKLEDLLRAFIEPVLALWHLPSGASPARLFARMLIDSGELFQQFFHEQMTHTSARFLGALRNCCPETPEPDLYWRMLFAVGAVGHALMGGKKIEFISQGKYKAGDIEGMVDRVITFCAAGFRAPVQPKGEAPCNGSH